MPRRLLVALICGLTLCGVLPTAVAAAPAPPNIVMFYIDDVSPHDGRLWNSPERTPAIHRHFVDQGIEFDNAIGESPLCCPARGNLLTGLHTHNNGVVTNDARLFDPTEHVGKALQRSGYATMFLGKYLNRTDLLTDTQWDAHEAGWTYLDVIDGINGAFYNYTLHTKVGDVSYGRYHSTQMVADRAVMRMRQVPADQPLFAVLSIYNLHASNVRMDQFIGDQRCADMPPWNPPNYNEADISDKPSNIASLPLQPHAGGWPMVNYCEEMLGVDKAVGEVTAELEAQGRLDNTLLVLAGDNGIGWGEHRIGQSKNQPYTTPVPLYMTWPARWGTQPRTVGDHTSNIDLAPTFCDAAGCELGPFPRGQPGPDGVSLLPLLDGDVNNLGRDAVLEVLLQGERPWTALRTTEQHPQGLWHYVERHGTGELELYDLEADPWELENLAYQPGHEELITQLAARLAELRTEGQPSGLGRITVALDALPNGGQDFGFAGSLGSFVLDDDSNGTRPKSITFSGLPSGAYTITQTEVPGWSLVDLRCTPGRPVNLTTRTATVQVTGSEHVSCTFTDAVRRPDTSIALSSSGAYKGNDVYSATPTSSQTQRRDGVVRGRTYSYWVRVQNDSLRPDSFTLRGEKSGASSMSVTYWAGSANITSQVVAGTYATSSLAPGARATIVVKIAVSATAGTTDVTRVVVRASSRSRPERVDVARAVAAR